MVDYIPKYLTKDGFDVPRLIHDDFFIAIKLLLTNGLYASCAKLLLSFIDSIGFVEYGDNGNPFVLWIDSYVDLRAVDITSEELWEHRNSMLHMTNLDSRKVLSGKVKRLIIYVGELPKDMPAEDSGTKYYSLQKLYTAIWNGISHWCASMNMDSGKLKTFMDRYDLVVSDARRLEVSLEK